MTGCHDWEAAILSAISTVDAVIFVAAPPSRQSTYVRDEIDVAKCYQRPSYPVWADGYDWIDWIDAVPLGWGSTQCCDLREQQYEQDFSDLLRALGVS